MTYGYGAYSLGVRPICPHNAGGGIMSMMRIVPIATVAAVLGWSAQAWAQLPQLQPGQIPPAGAQARQGAQPGGNPELSSQALQALVAGIALYPDPVIEQVLAAAQSPAAIHTAAQSVKAGQPADSSWPDSVKFLLQYPDLLQQLDAQLDWTVVLGKAAVSQLNDVWAAVDAVRAHVQEETAAQQAEAGQDGQDAATADNANANANQPAATEQAPTTVNNTYYAGGYYPAGWGTAAAAVTASLWTPNVYRELYHYDRWNDRQDQWYESWRNLHLQRQEYADNRADERQENEDQIAENRQNREDQVTQNRQNRQDQVSENRQDREDRRADNAPRRDQLGQGFGRPAQQPGDARFRDLPRGEDRDTHLRAANQAATEASRFHRGESPFQGFGRSNGPQGPGAGGFDRPGGAGGPGMQRPGGAQPGRAGGLNPGPGSGGARPGGASPGGQRFDRGSGPQRPQGAPGGRAGGRRGR